MRHAAGADIQFALFAFGNDVVKRLQFAFSPDEQASRISVDPSEVELVVHIKAWGLHSPVQNFWSHIAKDQAVGVRLVLAHVDLVADTTRSARKETRFKVSSELSFPDA